MFDTNRFHVGYEFTLNNEKRYIAYINPNEMDTPYETYPISAAAQITEDPVLMMNDEFNEHYRVCLSEARLYELKIEELERKLAEPQNTPLKVNTPLGVLTAEVSPDSETYPGIYISLTREDGIAIDLVACEVDLAKHCAKAYLYGDTATEDWTDSYTWSVDEINIDA